MIVKNIIEQIVNKYNEISKWIRNKLSYKKIDNQIYYIGGNTVLPTPLPKDEESYYIERLTSEKPEEKEYARKILIEHNLRLVVYIARKFENTGISIEDLISIGSIGLIKAINTYKADKNIKLATYASRCIENEILMYLRKNNKIKSEVSIDEPLNVDWEGNELHLYDILGTEPDIIHKEIESEIEKNLVSTAISKLSNREREIVELRYGIKNNGDELTQKEVADLLGISQSYISRLEKKIILRLKKDIGKLV